VIRYISYMGRAALSAPVPSLTLRYQRYPRNPRLNEITKRTQPSVNRRFQHFRFEMASRSAVRDRRYRSATVFYETKPSLDAPVQSSECNGQGYPNPLVGITNNPSAKSVKSAVKRKLRNEPTIMNGGFKIADLRWSGSVGGHRPPLQGKHPETRTRMRELPNEAIFRGG
jgi:hypothetical protein